MDGRVVTGGDDGIVAGQEGGDDGMRCPVCGFVNLTGADICDNCGADIFGHDTPMQAPAFKGQLLGEHLDELGAPPPITVGPDTPIDVAIARMHEGETDCVLVVAGERLVGIFT
ncbi:MAG TPA: CBS domain-containing protein, partial [Candidatus Limnocylindrales bacterium]|nr:CBS domain-containing protein [Candidatus Limnocylindrales bacterium]